MSDIRHSLTLFVADRINLWISCLNLQMFSDWPASTITPDCLMGINEQTSETQWSHPDGNDNDGVSNHKLVVVLRGSWSYLPAQPRIRWWRHEQVFIRTVLKCNKTLISQQRSLHWGGVGSFSLECTSFWSSRRFTCPYVPHPLNRLVFSVFT